jgi:hypothetical protein
MPDGKSKMTSSRLAKVALLLWVATISVFGWFFIRGNTVTGTDGRTAVVLQAGERALVLAEMRVMLAATQGIIEGVNQNDMQSIIKAASAAGMGAAADVNPALMAKLPLEFKTLGMSVHHDMDDIAKAAASGTPAPAILKMMSSTLNKCVSCHAAWKIQVGN